MYLFPLGKSFFSIFEIYTQIGLFPHMIKGPEDGPFIKKARSKSHQWDSAASNRS